MIQVNNPDIKNTSGIYPCHNHILVKPDTLEETTAGGIIVPQQVKAVHEISACYGVVIALGPDCFKHTVTVVEDCDIHGTWRKTERRTTQYSEIFAKAGDRIAFSTYSGLEQMGEDGEKYKTLNDTDITARVSDKVTQTTIEARKPLGAM